MKKTDIRRYAHEALDNLFDYIDNEDGRIDVTYDELMYLINTYDSEEEE